MKQQTQPTKRIIKPSELRAGNGHAAAPEPSAQDEKQLIADIVETAKKKAEQRQTHTNTFPMHSLHPRLQEYCKSSHKASGFPIDWYGCGVIVASMALIGNGYRFVYDDWKESPLIWLAIVGRSSSGKTKMMNQIMGPIWALQHQYFDQYDKELAEVRRLVAAGDPVEMLEKVSLKRLILKKFTLEKAIDVMRENPKSLLVYRSELLGWVKGMNMYKQGGDDDETWLEFFDNDDQLVDLKKEAAPIRIPRTNVSVWGGIQDDLLQKLVEKDKGENGGFGRILMCYPDEMDKPMPTRSKLSFEAKQDWEKIVARLNDNFHMVKKGSVTSIEIPLDEAANEAFFQYRGSSTKATNNAPDNLQRSIIGKLETYTLRLAGTLALLDLAADGVTITEDMVQYDEEGQPSLRDFKITEELVVRALALKDYFYATSQRVTTRIENPVNKYPQVQQEWYRSLPFNEIFKTSTAIESAKGLDIAQRTAETLLSNVHLFKKIKTGWYERRWF